MKYLKSPLYIFFAIVLFSAPSLFAAGEPGESLIQSDDAFKSSLRASNQATVELVEVDGQPVIKVDAPLKKFPGFEIKPIGGFDLSAYYAVEFTVTNTSDHSIGIGARVDNDGNYAANPPPFNAKSIQLTVGETKDIVVVFGKSYGKPGYQLDAAHVTRILVFAFGLKEPSSFTVSEIKGLKTSS